MTKKTPLYELHQEMGAKMVPFGGWEMPINYGSQIEEHHQVRRSAGMFDVSHMTIVDLRGQQVRPFLRKLFANDVDRLTTSGKALYTCMLNERGGVIDDLITYFLRDEWFRTVVNAATHDRDMAWIREQAEPFGVEVAERTDLAMVAPQGPEARAKALSVMDPAVREAAEPLKPFFATVVDEWFVARTGYTGEDGFEIMLPADQAPALWRALTEAGVAPCGLGARDTLRLEAGLNLYGHDMDESVTPLEAGLEWTVAWEPADRHFIGREALERKREDPDHPKLVGLVLEGKGVLRDHQRVIVEGVGEGEITSGGYSPTLGCAIGLARVPAATGDSCEIEMRGRRVPARVVKPPFVRNGKPRVEVPGT